MADSPDYRKLIERLFRKPPANEPKFFEELGRFIAAYAQAEAMIHTLARVMTKTDDERARIVFGGLRLTDSIDRLRALMRIENRVPNLLSLPALSNADMAAIEDCLRQFQIIGERRDRLVHRTITSDNLGFRVSNLSTAKSILNAEIDQLITLEDLKSMKLDCAMVYLKLSQVAYPERNHLGIPELGPWQYIPPKPDPQKPEHPLNRRARKRQRRASQA